MMTMMTVMAFDGIDGNDDNDGYQDDEEESNADPKNTKTFFLFLELHQSSMICNQDQILTLSSSGSTH